LENDASASPLPKKIHVLSPLRATLGQTPMWGTLDQFFLYATIVQQRERDRVEKFKVNIDLPNRRSDIKALKHEDGLMKLQF